MVTWIPCISHVQVLKVKYPFILLQHENQYMCTMYVRNYDCEAEGGGVLLISSMSEWDMFPQRVNMATLYCPV